MLGMSALLQDHKKSSYSLVCQIHDDINDLMVNEATTTMETTEANEYDKIAGGAKRFKMK